MPLELLEIVLMRAFLMLYSRDFEGDDDRHPCVATAKSWNSEWQAFTLLASVCSSWRFTLTGWPQSPTPKWVRHKMKQLIERECTYNTFVMTCTDVFDSQCIW